MTADDLLDIAGRLAASAAPGAPEQDFARAVGRWLQGETDTLDAALGLKPCPGQNSASSRWRQRRRNTHLRSALELIDAPSFTARCRALAAEISRFDLRVWPRWQALDAPPDGASELRRELFHARRLAPLPTSDRQIRDIARDAGSGF